MSSDSSFYKNGMQKMTNMYIVASYALFKKQKWDLIGSFNFDKSCV